MIVVANTRTTERIQKNILVGKPINTNFRKCFRIQLDVNFNNLGRISSIYLHLVMKCDSFCFTSFDRMTATRKNMAQTVCLNQPVVLFFRHSASSPDVFLWWFHAFVGFGFQFVDICPLVFEAPINYRKTVRFYDISADFGAEALCSGLTENVCPRGTDSLQLGKGNLRGPSNWTVSLQKDAAILSNCII